MLNEGCGVEDDGVVVVGPAKPDRMGPAEGVENKDPPEGTEEGDEEKDENDSGGETGDRVDESDGAEEAGCCEGNWD